GKLLQSAQTRGLAARKACPGNVGTVEWVPPRRRQRHPTRGGIERQRRARLQSQPGHRRSRCHAFARDAAACRARRPPNGGAAPCARNQWQHVARIRNSNKDNPAWTPYLRPWRRLAEAERMFSRIDARAWRRAKGV